MPTTLVVAAHPDDEALGCGATITKLARAGERVVVMFLTEGVGARGSGSAEAQARADMAHAAIAAMGAEAGAFHALPDNQLDTVPLLQVAQAVEAMVAQHQPWQIITHHAHDLNIDHRIAHQAVMTACRPQPGRSVKRILCFEVPSSTEWQTPDASHAFIPNIFVEGAWEDKAAALAPYAHELRTWPHTRSLQAIEALGRWRGATVGAPFAEAFMLAREIA